MKANRWFCLLLAICLVFTLSACGGGGGSDDPSGGGGNDGGNGGGNGETVIPASDDYLCFTANENNCSISTTVTGSLDTTPSLEYSKDKENWEPFIINSTTVDLPNTNDKVYIRATSSNASFSEDLGWITFLINKSVSASGNIMSLLDKNCGGTSVPKRAFYTLFENTTITTAPKLPATILAEYCYCAMFRGCSALITAPKLPATTLANSCYEHMFRGCSYLTTAPELPATNLAEFCYYSMFQGCSELTTAPELPATNLADFCYHEMFKGCSKLNYIKVRFTDWNVGGSTYEWVVGVAASGDFYCPKPGDPLGLNIEYGGSYIPTGWDVDGVNNP